MSGLGAGHVREMPLESDLETGYALLTQEKAERSDMSGLGADIFGQSLCNPTRGADMSGLTGVFCGRINFLCFTLHQLTQYIPLDSTKLLKLK
jgi:hypothetical protein